jgi:hypothetical protein
MTTGPLHSTTAVKQMFVLLLSVVSLSAAPLSCRRESTVDVPDSGQMSRATGGSTSSASESGLLDWVLIYQMSYDNNLAWAGLPILEMLRAGLTSDRVAVAIFADLPDDGGMFRIVLRGDDLEAVRLSTEDSASSSVFAQNLDWVGQSLPATRYALIFLDHGGRLDEIGLDAHPGDSGEGPGGSRWLSLSEVARVVRQWRIDHDAALELLFLQQCGKGSIESYWALRDTAEFLMASEVDIDAPNNYYSAVLREISATPDIDGRALARLIMRNEPGDSFGSFTVVDNGALGELPTRLNTALEPLLSLSSELVDAGRDSSRSLAAEPLDVLFHPAAGEEYVDLIAWLEALYRANGVDNSAVRELSTWLGATLMVERRVSPEMAERLGDSSGFSVLLPASGEVLGEYDSVSLFEHSLLDELHQRLLE